MQKHLRDPVLFTIILWCIFSSILLAYLLPGCCLQHGNQQQILSCWLAFTLCQGLLKQNYYFAKTSSGTLYDIFKDEFVFLMYSCCHKGKHWIWSSVLNFLFHHSATCLSDKIVLKYQSLALMYFVVVTTTHVVPGNYEGVGEWFWMIWPGKLFC